MKIRLNFLLKLLISLFFTFALLEVGLRLVPGLIPLDLLVYFDAGPRAEIARRRGLPTKESDSVLVERDDNGPDLRIFKPFTEIIWPVREEGATGVMMMDEVGFCNPSNSYQLPMIDIITLGDSFTTCHAVEPEDTWTSQLSSLTGLSTYNLGRSGTGILEYIQLFKKFGVQKAPQIVIMNIYEGNDFRDANNYYQASIEVEEAQQSPTSSTGLPYFLDLGHNFFKEDLLLPYSYAGNFLFATVNYWQDSYALTTDTGDQRAEVNFKYDLVFSEEIVIPFNLENLDKDEVEHATLLTTLQIEPEVFQIVEDALRTYVELSNQYDFVPIVTYTPSAHTTYKANVIFDDPKLAGLMRSFHHEQRQYLKEKGEKLGYLFIDLTPALQAAAKTYGPQEVLYFQYDMHLKPSGHTVIAEILAQMLGDLGLTP